MVILNNLLKGVNKETSKIIQPLMIGFFVGFMIRGSFIKLQILLFYKLSMLEIFIVNFITLEKYKNRKELRNF